MFQFKKSTPPPVEARGAVRYPVYLRTFYALDGADGPQTGECDIYDISSSGVRFHCGRDLSPGTQIVLLLKQGTSLRKMVAAVMWHGHFTEHKYGARFVQPDAGWESFFRGIVGAN